MNSGPGVSGGVWGDVGRLDRRMDCVGTGLDFGICVRRARSSRTRVRLLLDLFLTWASLVADGAACGGPGRRSVDAVAEAPDFAKAAYSGASQLPLCVIAWGWTLLCRRVLDQSWNPLLCVGRRVVIR
jgi:hypothetical protein